MQKASRHGFVHDDPPFIRESGEHKDIGTGIEGGQLIVGNGVQDPDNKVARTAEPALMAPALRHGARVVRSL